jgi:hypothetical protein
LHSVRELRNFFRGSLFHSSSFVTQSLPMTLGGPLEYLESLQHSHSQWLSSLFPFSGLLLGSRHAPNRPGRCSDGIDEVDVGRIEGWSP